MSAIERIQELQVLRRHAIRMQNRINNGCRAYVRTILGWQTGLPEKERAAINKRAEEIVKVVQTGGENEEFDVSATLMCVKSKQSREVWDTLRKSTETDMTEAAKALPVHWFVDTVCGFGSLGLALIVGEAGDLSNYATVAKLWKRMGLAVIDGRAQGRRTDPLEALEHGFSPHRRAVMWTIGDSLIKKQNGYRELYLEKKAEQAEKHPELTKMHAHRRAQRYMEKRLLRNLWRAWRKNSAEGQSSIDALEGNAHRAEVMAGQRNFVTHTRRARH